MEYLRKEFSRAIVRAIINKAAIDGLINEDQFRYYKVPKYRETLPVYLEESEIEQLFKLCRSLGESNLKTCGYYFLLSCFAGYRLSDAINFNYQERVHGKEIVLRAAKNNKIVSIPIHTRLKEVLKFIKDNPVTISEQHVRKYVKEACGLAGIKKEVKFHTARHSFAMLLMKSGFNTDEVAHLLGDSPAVARVYAKIHNPTLNAKVMNLLG